MTDLRDIENDIGPEVYRKWRDEETNRATFQGLFHSSRVAFDASVRQALIKCYEGYLLQRPEATDFDRSTYFLFNDNRDRD